MKAVAAVIGPKKIDQLAERWNELKAKQEALDKEFETVNGEILACVEAQGELAERSSKTRVATGQLWDLRATYGEETRIDQKKAREFCSSVGPVFAAMVFREETKLTLLQTPDRLEGGANLHIAARRLFQEAVQVKPRSPRVDVRSRLAKTA